MVKQKLARIEERDPGYARGQEKAPNYDVKPVGSTVQMTSREAAPHLVGGEERTSVNLGAILGLEVSMVKNPTVVEKLV